MTGMLACTRVLVFVFISMKVCPHEPELGCLTVIRAVLSVPSSVSVVAFLFHTQTLFSKSSKCLCGFNLRQTEI